MYKIAVVSVIALLAIQGCLAKPKAKQGAAPNSQIDELAANARQVIHSVSSSLEGNLPDTKQVSNSIVENTQKIATQLKSIVDDLNKQTADHKGDFENVLKQFEDNFKATAANLEKAVGPEATAKAKDLKKNIDESVNNAINEAQKLAKAVEPQAKQLQVDINNSVKNLLDKIVEAGRSLKQDFEKNAPKK